MSFGDDQNKEPLFKSILIYIFLGFFSFMVADLVLLKFVRIKFFPSYSAKDASRAKLAAGRSRLGAKSTNNDLVDYSKGYKHIVNRNMFSADGVISPPIASLEKGNEGSVEEEIFNDPVLSNLDLKLEGTIVHRNPYRSLATIESAGKTTSYTVGDQVENLAEIVSVVRKKVIIRNLSSKKLEYIEIPRDMKLATKRPPPKKFTPSFGGAKKNGSGLVKRDGDTFKAKRSDVNAQLSNMGKLLREAKVERAVDPVTGEVIGFKFTNIKEGSVISELGFNIGDTITSVDGEPVNSPNKAMMMYNKLKNASDVRIGIRDANGQDRDFEYSVED